MQYRYQPNLVYPLDHGHVVCWPHGSADFVIKLGGAPASRYIVAFVSASLVLRHQIQLGVHFVHNTASTEVGNQVRLVPVLHYLCTHHYKFCCM